MAVRLLTRTGLLYQDLLRHGEAAPGALPPVLSVVLYNGRRSRWTAAPELGRAAVPAGGRAGEVSAGATLRVA